MKRAIVVSAVLAAVGAFGGCGKRPATDPECRVFEQDPRQVSDRGTLEEMRAAWDDAERVRRCAQEAARTVREFMAEHRVEERLEIVERKLAELGGSLEQMGEQAAAAGRTVLGEARQTVERAREGAQQAVDEAQRRLEEGIRAATGE